MPRACTRPPGARQGLLRPTFQRDSRCVLKCRRALLSLPFLFYSYCSKPFEYMCETQICNRKCTKIHGEARAPPVLAYIFSHMFEFRTFLFLVRRSFDKSKIKQEHVKMRKWNAYQYRLCVCDGRPDGYCRYVVCWLRRLSAWLMARPPAGSSKFFF